MSKGDEARCVVVYRSSRVQDMYLIVDQERGLSPVPELLLARFGPPVEAFAFELTPDRKLARAAAPDVLRAIAEHGFYLQMPPVPVHTANGHGH